MVRWGDHSWDDSDDDDDDEDNEDDVIEDEIVEEFIRTFHNCNYDMEFDNALSLDRTLMTPALSTARPTQASYNKPDNWRERNRTGLEKIKRELQRCIWVGNDNSFHLVLRHNGNGDNEEPIVWNEPILDEYWNQLDAKMRQQDIVAEICDINIQNVEITRERLAALVDICNSGRANNSSTQAIFDNANICGEGIVWLSKLIEARSVLRCFCLRYNRIDNMDSVRCLSRSLKSHTCINHLDLSHCNLGSSPEVLSVLLQADVNRIILEHNNIDSLGAVTIAKYLENNPPIWNINLNHNRFSDDDAILISQALKRNTNLVQIDIVANNLTSVGVKALLTCVVDNSSLNTISESNHTLGR
jgi:hypothetical protein